MLLIKILLPYFHEHIHFYYILALYHSLTFLNFVVGKKTSINRLSPWGILCFTGDFFNYQFYVYLLQKKKYLAKYLAPLCIALAVFSMYIFYMSFSKSASFRGSFFIFNLTFFMKNTLSTLNQKGFEIVSVTSQNMENYISGIARVYKDVFNSSAWREWVKCSSLCWFKATFEDAPGVCPNCSGAIEDFYSNIEIQESVEQVLSKTYSQCLLLLQEWNVAWFTWGWRDTLQNINADKLWLWDRTEAFDALIRNLEKNDIDLSSWEIYYQSETGISPSYRMKWLGTSLVALNEEYLRSNAQKVNSIIQRTSRNSPMYSIRENLGYTEVFSYDDEDQRVLFSRNNY